MDEIAVVYLYRFREGEEPARNFLESYKRFPAGIKHRLYVILKGFPDERRVQQARAIFGQDIHVLIQSDYGFDIGSYVFAAKEISCHNVMFLNTFSEILARDWLLHFRQALSLSGVGLVGATGSWHANTSGYEAIFYQALRMLFLSRSKCPQNGEPFNSISQRRKVLLGPRPLRSLLLEPLRYARYLFEYGRYPNPHIRTNAFMLERERFLTLKFPEFGDKSSAYKFESGRRSMTRQIINGGSEPVVIDKTGNVFYRNDWSLSLTFWAGVQDGLLISDNRTRAYAEGDEEYKHLLHDYAWVHPALWRKRF